MDIRTEPHFSMDISGNTATGGSTQVNGPVVGGNLTYNVTQNINGPKTEEDKQQECMNMLYSTDPATDRNKLIAAKGESVEGTCQWILETKEFKSWLESDKGTLWITGGPGKGKTFLSIHILETLPRIAKELDSRTSPLILQYFCDNTDSHRNSALGIIRGLLYQLLGTHQDLFKYILPAFYRCKARNQNLFTEAFTEELWGIFECMMLDQTMSGRRGYLVLDGLDECDTKSIKLIAMKLNAISSSGQNAEKCNIRPVLLSRALDNAVIRNAIKVNLDLDYSERRQVDLDTFIATRVKEIFPKEPWEEDDPWTESLRAALLERAGGTFLWAGLAMQMLQDQGIDAHGPLADSEASLEKWLPLGLDAMYNRILLEIPNQAWADTSKILRWVSIAMRPLGVKELCVILEINPAVMKQKYLRLLRHLLLTTADGKLHLVHLSLKEYLLSLSSASINFQNPSVDLAWFGIAEAKTNLELFTRCMNLMRRMKKDMCELGVPDALAADVKQDSGKLDMILHLQYGCRHWVDHLRLSASEAWHEEVLQFVREHFLHWLECMSILGFIYDTLPMLNILKEIMVEHKSGKASDLLHWTNDARRFIFSNISITEDTPLQVYSSCLLFAPSSSIIRQESHLSIPQHWFHELPRVQSFWGSDLYTFEGHSGSVNAVKFSPDSRKIASGSTDKTVRICDLATGTVESVLPHDEIVEALDFSPDGSKLATISRSHHGSDRHVKVWDARTEAVTFASTWYKVHYIVPCFVAFSGSGSELVLSVGPRDLEVWDLTAVPPRKKIVDSRKAESSCFLMSPVGSIFAVGRDSGEIDLWSTRSWDVVCSGRHYNHLPGKYLGKERDPYQVQALAFSFDGNILASAHSTGELILWNLRIGDLGQQIIIAERVISQIIDPGTLTRCIKRFDGINFLAGDTRMAIAESNVVYIFEVAREAVVHSLRGHSAYVSSVALSPDLTMLATGSGDATTRVWDMTSLPDTTNPRKRSDNWIHHTPGVERILFSPNGEIVVSSSVDGIVRVWDTATAKSRRIFEIRGIGHEIIFSPDSSRMACAEELEGQVLIWNTATWDVDAVIMGLESPPFSESICITFSPDGDTLILSSRTGIRLYRVQSGYQLERVIIPGELWESQYKTLRKWGVHTASSAGAQYFAMVPTYRLGMSPELLVLDISGDKGKELALPPMEQRLARRFGKADFIEGEGEYTGIRFTPDGRTLFATLDNGYTRIWDLVTKQTVHRLICPDCQVSIDNITLQDIKHIINSAIFSVDTSGRWVTQNGKKILRLPANLIAQSFTTKDGNLAIGTESGRVLFLKFREEVEMYTV